MQDISSAVLSQAKAWAGTLVGMASTREELCPPGQSIRVEFPRKVARGVIETYTLTGFAAYGSRAFSLTESTDMEFVDDSAYFRTAETQIPTIYRFKREVRKKGRLVVEENSYLLVVIATPADKEPQTAIDVDEVRAELTGQYWLTADAADALIKAASPEFAIEAARIGLVALTTTGNPRAAFGVLTRLHGVKRAQRSELRSALGYEIDMHVTPDQVKQLLRHARYYIELGRQG